MGAVSGASDVTGEDRSFHFIQSVERAINVIRAFTVETPRLTLSEVARAVGQERATARRFLLTLADLGYVASDGRMFFLTPKVLELGYAYLSSLSIPEIVEPRLRLLVKEVRETCNVAVLDQTSIVYIARVPSPGILASSINVGTRLPAYPMALGRVLLAFLREDELDQFIGQSRREGEAAELPPTDAEIRMELAQVREQGWASVSHEPINGLISIAAPIRDAAGVVIAAANIAATASRTSSAEIQRTLLPALLQATEDIAATRAI
jgi:IclR family transcriptional regulator, pca regulon regulatory protein